MSKNLSAVANTEFDSIIKHAFQGSSLLRDCVTVRNNVVGDTYNFRRMGKGLANNKATADLFTPLDVAHELKTATLTNATAGEYTDIFDQHEVNFDEKNELAMTISMALGRTIDQRVIDAMDASTPLTSAVTAGGTNLTMAKVINAKTELVDQGVGNERLFAIVNAAGLRGLLNDEKAASGDYQATMALISGKINSLCGFEFKFIETRAEGGLTIASNIVDSWFFAMNGIGLAMSGDPKINIDWIGDRTAWSTVGTLKCGSVVRDEGGLVKVQYDQTA